MNVARSVSDVLSTHVTLELESIDRMYLNLYVPILQRPEGAAHFWMNHRGNRMASSALMGPMSRAFVSSIEGFATSENIPLLPFEKGEKKSGLGDTSSVSPTPKASLSSGRLKRRLLWCVPLHAATQTLDKLTPG